MPMVYGAGDDCVQSGGEDGLHPAHHHLLQPLTSRLILLLQGHHLVHSTGIGRIRAVDPDPHSFSLLDPDPHSICGSGSMRGKFVEKIKSAKK